MIRARDLTVRIGERTILDGISLEVAQGEVVGLVGANGSGKSTLLRCLVGLVPYRGELSVGGRDVAADPVGAKSLIGYLPQKPAFGDARAEEALRWVARLRGVPVARVGEVLQEVGLAAFARERAATFSGGMQQRLSLAMALLSGAPVMLLDEPTASLDLEGQRTFAEIAGSLRSSGRTVLISSHRPGEIGRLASRVVHLDSGRVVEPPADNVVPLPHALGGMR
jgi:ABC-type multidrug transport system ATPase subunit